MRPVRTARPLTVSLLLLAYLFTRLHNLLALPLFIDESFHIEMAQRFRDGQILASASHGRLLLVWSNAILGSDPPGASWVTRAGIVLVSLLGVASIYALARAFVSHRAGLIAGGLWISTPYFIFYERMALADPMLSALSVLAVWMAWLMIRTGTRWAAIGLGLALGSVLLAKASGVVWLPLPLIAVLLMSGTPWRRRLLLCAFSYSTFGLLWGPLFLLLRLKGYNYFGLASHFVTDRPGGFWDRLWTNVSQAWKFDAAYVGLPLVLLAAVGGLYWLARRPRSALLALMALGMSAGGTILFGENVNSRYALNQVAWVLLPLAVGTGLWLDRLSGRWQVAVYAAWAIWLAVFAIPFLLDAWDDPTNHQLAGYDPREYIQGDASGYGVTEIGHALSQIEKPLPILGLVANCQTLRLAAYPAKVTCPRIHWEADGAGQSVIMKQAEQWAANGPIYVVGEELPYIDLTQLPQPFTVIRNANRPGSDSTITLFRLEMGATRPAAD